MQGLKDVNLAFFAEVFRNYWGHVALYAVYFAAVLCAFSSRDRIYRNIYGYGAAVALFTVFNPAAAGFFVKLFGLQERYYRFYWILPVAPLIAMFFVGIVRKTHGKFNKAMAGAVILTTIVLCGRFDVYDIDSKSSNIYKIDEEIIEISGIIHAYAPEADRINAYYGWDVLTQIRTYDASICTPVGRYEYYDHIDTDSIGQKALEGNNFYLLVLMEYNGMEFPAERVAAAFDEYGINCYIRRKTQFSGEYIDSLNMELIGETDNYEVYWYK